ncbi:MAG: PSD1 and planctomycete cytochrome C domain-containing protein [Isosphaeraceae bacterium]
MMQKTLAALLVLVSGAMAGHPGARGGGMDSASIEFFESKIRPLLVEKCLSCHGTEKQKGGLRLDSREAVLKGGDSGPALVPGDLEGSLLIEAVRYQGEPQMPPKGKLKGDEVEALGHWVKMGAPWPETSSLATTRAKENSKTPTPRADPLGHWAFRPVSEPAIPTVKDPSLARGAIDRFIVAKLEQQGLRPVEQADKQVLIRRLTFDLIGLPPTPDEVDTFLADESPGAYERVVDRLLASPHHGERWGRHWLDVARYGEDQAHTFEARKYPYGYKYRDWVVQALNADMPYDRFVLEQIAGDQLEGADRDGRLAALGFFALGPVYYGKAIADERDDRIDTFSRGFLGLTVSCARCHDHKFDPIPTQDYYALAGVFASTRYREYPSGPREVVETYEKAQASIQAKTTEIGTFLALSSFRRHFFVPKDLAENLLPKDSRGVLKALRAELEKRKGAMPPAPAVIHALEDAKTIADLRSHVWGSVENLGEVAPRRFLTILSKGEPVPFRQGSGRLELARAVVDRENPLTARVMVNRIWEHHFGRGLVATPSNFGTLGEPSSHPELLDYLATRLVASGWSIKSIHREIVLSSTYQRSSRIDPKNEEADADNVWLWRMNRRRLEVEAWRDSMLAVSGNLVRTLGGPSQELVSPENRRRTFYAAISRHNLDGLLRLFDFPDPNLTCDRRGVTSVPLQQLFVLNSEFMVRQARALAKRLTADRGESDEARVRRAFPILLGRPASDDEVRWGLEFLEVARTSRERQTGALAAGGPGLGAWDQYAQILLGSNEFAFVD